MLSIGWGADIFLSWESEGGEKVLGVSNLACLYYSEQSCLIHYTAGL